jgi:hypothetical protein
LGLNQHPTVSGVQNLMRPLRLFPTPNAEESVDVEVVRIVKEKQLVFGAFDDDGFVRDRASDDAKDRERVEV